MSLSDAQLVIAREYGFTSWRKLKQYVEGLEAVEQRVSEIRETFARADADTRRRLLDAGHARERFENYDPEAASLSEADARLLVANQEGYAYWQKYDSYLHLDPSVQRVIDAVRTGNRETLQAILRDEPWASGPRWVAGFVPPLPIPNDSIPLFCVSEGSFRGTNARGNEYELIRDLVAAGAEVDIECGLPLAGAVSFNVIAAVDALLESGADVDGVDRDGTPMAYALHFGYTATAELLARREAKLDLRFASGLGRLDAVKHWFNADGSLKPGAGALVDPYALERKLRGESPFRCERTRENILSQALYFACIHNRLEVADFLLSQRADINAIVPGLDFRATVLHRAAALVAGSRTSRELETIIRFLIERGADPTIRDEEYGATPLGWARYAGRNEAVALLRSLGAPE
jgi:ankyrin repeat protein